MNRKTTWQLQEAKNRLSELIRRVELGDEQVITVRGKPVAVVVSYETHRGDQGRKTGKQLRDLMRQCPLPDLFEKIPERTSEPMREVDW